MRHLRSARLALTDEEEDVLRDFLTTSDNDDRKIAPSHRNALHTLRIKTALHFSASRGVDVREAVTATQRLDEHTRAHGLELRLSYDFDAECHVIRVGEQEWRWGTLYTLLPRIAEEVGAEGGRACTRANPCVPKCMGVVKRCPFLTDPPAPRGPLPGPARPTSRPRS